MKRIAHIAARDDPGVPHLLPLIITAGGILTGLCYLCFQAALAWVCLIPLFHILEKTTRHGFTYGLSYGIIAGAILFYWTIPVAMRYSGRFTPVSLSFYLLAVVYTAIYFGLFCVGYAWIRAHVRGAALRGISASSLFTLLEYLKLSVLPGLPWLKYNLALSQSPSMAGIQLASVGGVYGIIFTVVLVNFLAARSLSTKRFRALAVPALLVLCYYAAGSVMAGRAASPSSSSGTIRICLATENTPAEFKWNDRSGDSLVTLLFRLSDQAAAMHPELIVWTETPVPWTFSLEDPFLRRMLAITYPSRADHLFGMFSPVESGADAMHNSVFLIRHDGSITNRYDKNTLLSFLEEPVVRRSSLTLPLFNASVFANIIPGRVRAVMASGKARLGVLICNEILTGSLIPDYKDKSNLLVVMSNDAWFEKTPVTAHHFFIARFYAVMTGKSVVVNSNRGICGLIGWNGKILRSQCSTKAQVLPLEPDLAGVRTIYADVGKYELIAYILLLLVPLRAGQKKNDHDIGRSQGGAS